MTEEQHGYFRGGIAALKQAINGVEHFKITCEEEVTADDIIDLLQQSIVVLEKLRDDHKP